MKILYAIILKEPAMSPPGPIAATVHIIAFLNKQIN